MEKVCFVINQYGEEICGGGEYHCKMLAERLVPDFGVDVLTTKICDAVTLEQGFTQACETINGVRVLRFDCVAYDARLQRRAKWARKFRRGLFRLGLLRYIADVFPVWHLGLKREHAALLTDGFGAPGLLAYLQENQTDYKAIIFVSHYYPYSKLGFRAAPEKSIFIPTAHNVSHLFWSVQTHVFTGVRHIAFNTEEERSLARRVFGRRMAPSSIVGVGVETEMGEAMPSDAEMRKKFGLPDRYVHYFGRIAKGKMGKLIPWFIDYKRKHPGDLKLVLTGKLFMPKVEHPDIVYTGFVSGDEKIWLIKNSLLAINPSKNESLSLLLLEAMSLGKTVLVNGRSEVMKAHCIKSGFAADYYLSRRDFQRKLHRRVSDGGLLQKDNAKARDYVNAHYSWDAIMGKLRGIIAGIS